MTYLKCNWNHSFPDAPITLYSELDDLRWELRKVEVFRDARMGYADGRKEVGGSRLGLSRCLPWQRLLRTVSSSPSKSRV